MSFFSKGGCHGRVVKSRDILSLSLCLSNNLYFVILGGYASSICLLIYYGGGSVFLIKIMGCGLQNFFNGCWVLEEGASLPPPTPHIQWLMLEQPWLDQVFGLFSSPEPKTRKVSL